MLVMGGMNDAAQLALLFKINSGSMSMFM